MSEFELQHSNGIYIPHLSASTINSFITDRFGFYQSKVKRAPFSGNQYTVRGQAVEGAINEWLEKGDDNVRATALRLFDEKITETGLHKIVYEDVRDTVEDLADLAFGVYQNEFSGKNVVTQHKISCENLPGVSRPIIGYLDFYLPEVVIRDSKVSNKTPSKLSQSYIIQGAFYKHTTGLDVVFDFFVPNKKPTYKDIWLTDENFKHGLSYMTQAAKVIEEIETCDDPKRLMELMSFPNIDALYNDKDKKKAAELWEIEL